MYLPTVRTEAHHSHDAQRSLAICMNKPAVVAISANTLQTAANGLLNPLQTLQMDLHTLQYLRTYLQTM